jgi:hypothetical protein
VTEHFDQRVAAGEPRGGLPDLLCLAVPSDHGRRVPTGEVAALADWPADVGAQWRAWAVRAARACRSVHLP